MSANEKEIAGKLADACEKLPDNKKEFLLGYDKSMDGATDEYLDHLKARAMTYDTAPTVALEVQVDFSDIVPEGFGTADCVMIGSGVLDVVDYQQVLAICGMPSTTKGGTSTSDTGAAVLYRDGWYQADTYARNTEDLFKVSNRRFDRIFTKILRMKGIVDISLADFELQFTRNETANLLVKTQAALNLKNLGFSPELAFGKSGVSSDPVADVALCRPYIDRMWGNQQNTEQIDETRTDILA